jgi:hypothetical protein
MSERPEAPRRYEQDDEAPMSFGRRMAKLRAAKLSKRGHKKRRKATTR